MAYQNTGTIGPEDGDALISLKEGHGPTDAFVKQLRTILPQKFPGATFSFLPADIVSQILNFGLPAPINIQVVGNDQPANYAYATELLEAHPHRLPVSPTLRIQQVFNYPQLNVDVDRTLADEVGLTQRDVANSLLVTLSGSGQVRRTSGSTRERRLLPDRRPDAAIPHRQMARAAQPCRSPPSR